MKVYIVSEYQAYEGCQVKAVFLSKEKADKYMKHVKEEYHVSTLICEEVEVKE